MCPLLLLTSLTSGNRRDSVSCFVRLYESVCVRLSVYHHPLRRGMSGRTECDKPSVTIAHRDIFTPTPALSRNPSIPILHTSRRLITVTSPRRNFFLRLRQCRGLPGERARTFVILLAVVCFLSLGKSLGYCRRNAVPCRKKAKFLTIVADLAPFTIANVLLPSILRFFTRQDEKYALFPSRVLFIL